MKKKYLILLITIILVIGTFIVYIINTNKHNEEKSYNVDQIENKVSDEEEIVDDSESEDSIKKETDSKVDEVKEDKKEESKQIISNNKTESKKEEIKTEVKKDNIQSTTIKSDPTSSSNNVLKEEKKEIIKEEPKEEPKQEPKKYIGVPSPSSYYYSFHHGKIEYSNLNTCESDSFRIMEKDPEDIYGGWCMEVQDDNGTVLGAYLYLKCYSGNCDKYKG